MNAASIFQMLTLFVWLTFTQSSPCPNALCASQNRSEIVDPDPKHPATSVQNNPFQKKSIDPLSISAISIQSKRNHLFPTLCL